MHYYVNTDSVSTICGCASPMIRTGNHSEWSTCYAVLWTCNNPSHWPA